MNLYQGQSEKEYIIKSIPNVGMLSSIGIFEGVKIKKIARHKMGGPVRLLLGTRNIAIGKKIAEDIEVEQCK